MGLIKKLIVGALLVLGVTSTSVAEDFPGTWVEEMNNTTYSPQTEFHYKEKVPWTTWNKTLFASAIGGHALDLHSTQDGWDRGCVEGNPFLEDMSIGEIAAVKVVYLGALYYLTEYLIVNPENPDEHQVIRNIVWGANALLGGAVAYHNYTLDCN